MHLVNIVIMNVTYELPSYPVLGTGIFASSNINNIDVHYWPMKYRVNKRNIINLFSINKEL